MKFILYVGYLFKVFILLHSYLISTHILYHNPYQIGNLFCVGHFTVEMSSDSLIEIWVEQVCTKTSVTIECQIYKIS